MLKPTVGRTVHYMLSSDDADTINRRRTDSRQILDRMAAGAWSIGAQAHVGNAAEAGQVFPMVIVRCWGTGEEAAVNGQVMLDGNDVLWVTSATQIETAAPDDQKPGRWFEPARGGK